MNRLAIALATVFSATDAHAISHFTRNIVANGGGFVPPWWLFLTWAVLLIALFAFLYRLTKS